MRKYCKVLSFVVAGSVGMFMAAPARADLIPALISVEQLTSGPDAGDYNWTYDVQVTATEETVASTAAPTPTTGTYLTMYDVAGLVSGTESMPTGWTWSEQTTGVTPNTEFPADDNASLNITWNYSIGPDVVGPADVGAFDFISAYGTPVAASDFYAAQATDTVGAESGTMDQDDGHIPAPTASIPLPSGLAIGTVLCGLIIVGQRYYKAGVA